MDSRLEALDYSEAEHDRLFEPTTLEHLCMFWFEKIDGGDPVVGPGCAAWTIMWQTIAPDDHTRIEGQSRGFAVGLELGLRLAQSLLKDPLAASQPEMRAALERAVEQYRWYEREALR